MEGVESAAAIPANCPWKAGPPCSEPQIQSAAEGTKETKGQCSKRREGHHKNIFFRAPAIVRGDTRNSDAAGGRRCSGSFSWIDHRFFRKGFDQGLTRLEKLLYLVLVAVSNRDGVSFYSDERLGELLEIRHRHELTGARDELVARDLIAFKDGVYQVLDLSAAPKN
jgi:hypothetical protein